MAKKRKRGRPRKITPQLVNRILAKLAIGLTKEQACAACGIALQSFQEAEDWSDFPGLRAKATAARAAYLLQRIEKEPFGWKRFAWLLEHNKAYANQFEDTGTRELLRLQLNQQNNFNQETVQPGAIMLVGEELDKARARLEETKLRQARRLNDVIDQHRDE